MIDMNSNNVPFDTDIQSKDFVWKQIKKFPLCLSWILTGWYEFHG